MTAPVLPKAPPSVLVVRVPLPPRWLSPNGSHGHWSREAESRLLYRTEVFEAAYNAVVKAKWKAPELASISLVFATRWSSKCDSTDHLAAGRKLPCCRCRYGPMDIPNAISAFKAGFDALKDGHAIREDHFRALELGRVTIDPSQGPWVDVTLQAVAR